MRKLSITIACIALAGCSTSAIVQAEKDDPLTEVQLTPQQRAVVERTIRADLKDPGSAKFGNMVAGMNARNTITVCGMVSAKNSYDGSTGPRTFAGILSDDSTEFIVMAFDREDATVNATCRTRGLVVN